MDEHSNISKFKLITSLQKAALLCFLIGLPFVIMMIAFSDENNVYYFAIPGLFFLILSGIFLLAYPVVLFYYILTEKFTYDDWLDYKSDLHFELGIKLEEFWDKNKWKILISSFIILIALIIFCVAHLFEIFIFIWIIIMIYGWIMGRN